MLHYSKGSWSRKEGLMKIRGWRTILGRLLILGAVTCGIIGLVIGIVDRTWKLGVTGWFTGGILLAVLAIAMLVDEYFQARRDT